MVSIWYKVGATWNVRVCFACYVGEVAVAECASTENPVACCAYGIDEDLHEMYYDCFACSVGEVAVVPT